MCSLLKRHRMVAQYVSKPSSLLCALEKIKRVGRFEREKAMRISFTKLGNSLPFSKLFRQLEQEMETVVKVLQPGPLGIIEHKFSAEEIHQANATVARAVVKWQQNATLERRNNILKDFIHK